MTTQATAAASTGQLQDDCLFCKMIRKQIPHSELYRDEHTLAFLDISPVNPGHALVIPTQHFAQLHELPPSNLQALFTTVQKVAKAVKQQTRVEGYNILMNNGEVSGQVIPHAHCHIIPRKFNNRSELAFPQVTKYESIEQQNLVASEIKQILDQHSSSNGSTSSSA